MEGACVEGACVEGACVEGFLAQYVVLESLQPTDPPAHVKVLPSLHLCVSLPPVFGTFGFLVGFAGAWVVERGAVCAVQTHGAAHDARALWAAHAASFSPDAPGRLHVPLVLAECQVPWAPSTHDTPPGLERHGGVVLLAQYLRIFWNAVHTGLVQCGVSKGM